MSANILPNEIDIEGVIKDARLSAAAVEYDHQMFAVFAIQAAARAGYRDHIDIARHIFVALAASRHREPDLKVFKSVYKTRDRIYQLIIDEIPERVSLPVAPIEHVRKEEPPTVTSAPVKPSKSKVPNVPSKPRRKPKSLPKPVEEEVQEEMAPSIAPMSVEPDVSIPLPSANADVEQDVASNTPAVATPAVAPLSVSLDEHLKNMARETVRYYLKEKLHVLPLSEIRTLAQTACEKLGEASFVAAWNMETEQIQDTVSKPAPKPLSKRAMTEEERLLLGAPAKPKRINDTQELPEISSKKSTANDRMRSVSLEGLMALVQTIQNTPVDINEDEVEADVEQEGVDAEEILQELKALGNPASPTSAKPGTEEKVRMMRLRYATGQDLYHPGDVVEHGPSTAKDFTAGILNGHGGDQVQIEEKPEEDE